jgi:hypothetical protein
MAFELWARSAPELLRACGLPDGWPIETVRHDGEWTLFRVSFALDEDSNDGQRGQPATSAPSVVETAQ